MFALTVASASIATLGFGVWRVIERVPTPPTHRAALENDGDTIRQRAANGLPIDELPPRGFDPVGLYLSSWDRPLSWAATLGHEDAVAALIDAGADLGADNNSALNQAAKYGHAGVCRLLLEAGADPLAKSRHEAESFEHALRSGDARTIEVFLDFVPADDRRRLIAAAHQDPAVLADVLENSDWSAIELDDAMLSAAKAARVESIKVMIAHGFDAAACQQPLLLEAVDSGSIETARLLAEAGASATIGYSYRHRVLALSNAVEHGDPEMVALVLRAGGDVHEPISRGETVLHAAARTAPLEVLDQLIAAGVSLDFRPSHGGTALMEAVEYRRLDVIERLLEAGADPRVRDSSGRTALDHARGFTESEYRKVDPAPPEIIRALEHATRAF
ncbi:MAG: ankyrin repeat domain-containing protein [Phycisphaerales bacterium JB064]